MSQLSHVTTGKGWAAEWLDRERKKTGRLAGSRAPTIPRAVVDFARATAEKDQPTRARAVIAFIDILEKPLGSNREDRRREKRQRSKAKEQMRRQRWVDPTQEEKEIRELNRMMRHELERAPDEDGEISGPLAVVAKYATPQILAAYQLSEDHTKPFEQWLMAIFGDVLRYPNIEGYLKWRGESNAQSTDRGG